MQLQVSHPSLRLCICSLSPFLEPGIGLKLYECAGDLLILELVLDNHYETAVRPRSLDKDIFK